MQPVCQLTTFMDSKTTANRTAISRGKPGRFPGEMGTAEDVKEFGYP